MSFLEKIARIIEATAWKPENFMGGSLAYQNRRTASLRKAKRVLEALPTGVTLAASVDAYLSECDNPVADGIYRHSLREAMRAALKTYRGEAP